MRKNLFTALCSCMLLLSISITAIASDVTVSGSAYFKCNFISKYMVKHGYLLIKENAYEGGSMTNLFAARDSEVIIKNQTGTVVGTGRTDTKGTFSINVPEDSGYKIVFRFHGHEIEKSVSCPDAMNYIADLGQFSTEMVGDWIDAKLGLK